METLSFIVLILLCLVGYSAGAASKLEEAKPRIIDLFLVAAIWAGAIYSRLSFDLNKWLLILIWVIAGGLVGFAAFLPQRISGARKETVKKLKEPSVSPEKNLWQRWKAFSYRMGSFQSRVILSLFFFIFVSPFALAVRSFSDPLRMKKRITPSYWLPKKEITTDLDQYMRQF